MAWIPPFFLDTLLPQSSDLSSRFFKFLTILFLGGGGGEGVGYSLNQGLRGGDIATVVSLEIIGIKKCTNISNSLVVNQKSPVCHGTR